MRRTRSRTAKHVALNFEIAISSMLQLYYGRRLWSKVCSCYPTIDSLQLSTAKARNRYETLPQWHILLKVLEALVRQPREQLLPALPGIFAALAVGFGGVRRLPGAHEAVAGAFVDHGLVDLAGRGH